MMVYFATRSTVANQCQKLMKLHPPNGAGFKFVLKIDQKNELKVALQNKNFRCSSSSHSNGYLKLYNPYPNDSQNKETKDLGKKFNTNNYSIVPIDIYLFLNPNLRTIELGIVLRSTKLPINPEVWLNNKIVPQIYNPLTKIPIQLVNKRLTT